VNRGLWYLLWRDWVGQGRRLARRLRGWRGAAALLALALLLGLGVAMRLLPGADAARPELGADVLRSLGPLFVIALALLATLTGGGLYFRPAEIHFLFPAPLGRRQLVLYNVLARSRVALLSAFWIALLALTRRDGLAQLLLGTFLALVTLQVLSQLAAVAGAWLAERVPRGLGVALGAGVLLSLLILLSRGLASLPGQPASPAGPVWLDSSLLAGLGFVARPPFEVMTAETGRALWLWTGVSLGLLAALLLAIARLDTVFREAVLARSRRRERELARMRSGGGVFAAGPTRSRVALPRFPRLEGAGPLAWRQSLELLRNPRGIVTMSIVVGMTAAVAIYAPFVMGRADAASIPVAALAWTGVGAVVAATLFMADNFAFDFRRDLDRMAFLKSLPISALALVAGQIATVAAFRALVQVVAIGVIALATGAISAAAFLAATAILLPASWAAATIDNLVFLVVPYRVVPEDPGDFGFVGRIMLVMVMKLFALALLALLALAAGYLCYRAAGGSLSLAVLAAASLFAAACAPLTLLVAKAFRRYE